MFLFLSFFPLWMRDGSAKSVVEIIGRCFSEAKERERESQKDEASVPVYRRFAF